MNTNLSVDALGGHTLSADVVTGAVDTRSLHPAAAQRKLFQPLRVPRITSFCREKFIKVLRNFFLEGHTKIYLQLVSIIDYHHVNIFRMQLLTCYVLLFLYLSIN